jgi:hypothetical protein
MERIISLNISMVGTGWRPNGPSNIRKGRTMPILIWIATVACMLEIAMGHTPDQSTENPSARGDEDLDQ